MGRDIRTLCHPHKGRHSHKHIVRNLWRRILIPYLSSRTCRCSEMRFLLICALLFFLQTCYASSGDRAQIYQDCVSGCRAQNCDSSLTDLSLALRLTRWTCTDDCKYQCMHLITDVAIASGDKIHQYHGKWPFWRFGGVQEPASVVFSLLNMVAHIRGAQEVRRWIPEWHPMKWYYFMFSIVSINAWIWSSVFHTRGTSLVISSDVSMNITLLDIPATEKLDYFSAALAILYALFYTVTRLFHLYPKSSRQHLPSSGRSLTYTLWAGLCCLAYLGHITYLTVLPRFDYTYNMAFNLGVGMTHNILWLLYSLPPAFSFIRRYPGRPRSYRPPFASKAAAFVLLTTAATGLELFDFPPWYRTIDAHSLWHLATAPIATFWYRFLIEDALDDGWKHSKEE